MLSNEVKDLLVDLTIVIDTREKKIAHIIDYFDSHNIKYVFETLPSGDYSFKLPNHPEYNLDYTYIIERKNSLDEICGNFTKKRQQFVNEFNRLKESQNIAILIEGATWKKISGGSYRSQFHPNSLIASLLIWHFRYNCPIWTVEKSQSGFAIFKIIYYFLKKTLDNL